MAQTSPGDRTVRAFTPIPPGYVFVPKGNVYITKNCRRLTQALNEPIYTVQSGKKKTLGIRVPESVYTQVLADNNATAVTRAEKVKRKDQNLEDKTEAELLNCVPRIPGEHVPLILRHTLQKRSRRVGRSKEMPVSQVVELAVRAYIRHKLTDYDMLLGKGLDREKARKLIQGSIDKRVKQWGGSVEHAKVCRDNGKAGRKQHTDPKFQSSRTSGSKVQKREAKTGSSVYKPKPHRNLSAVPTTSGSIERQSESVLKKTLAHRLGRTNSRTKDARETVANEKVVILISDDDDDDFMDVDLVKIESDSLDDSNASYRDE